MNKFSGLFCFLYEGRVLNIKERVKFVCVCVCVRFSQGLKVISGRDPLLTLVWYPQCIKPYSINNYI